MSLTAPLLTRKANENVAFLNKELPSLNGFTGLVDTELFLSHVISLADQLPKKTHIINLCGNRYLFLVSICAAMLKQQINLLPPNKNLSTQAKLAERYVDAYVVHDGIDIENGLESFNIQDIVLAADKFNFSKDSVPLIPLEQLALISFTSGSTGDSKPNEKNWHTLTASSDINRRYMLPDLNVTYHILATVPGQHMWGLETSVLMALFSQACLCDDKPLFPADIRSVLKELPSPRVLVTTPVHLRALVSSGLSFPDLDYLLCATSPLTQLLAQKSEKHFKTKLHEVYGCSEIGSMAIRKTAIESDWLKFDGITFENESEKTWAYTEYLPKPITLSDEIRLDENNRFRLLGRSSDMVDIAGKRGSLAEINTILLQSEGLIDGVVIFPEQEKAIPRLAAIVMLKEGYSKSELQAHFRKYLDDVFVPRPIFLVDKLPREDNGKLPRKRIDELYQQLINKKA